LKLDRDHFSIIVSMSAKVDDPLTHAMVEMMTKK
jgi:hypothetical protein